MVAEFLFVLLYAAVELVGQSIDRSVHIVMNRVGVDFAAAQVDGGLGLMMRFFDCENAVHVYHMIGMPHDTLELFLHITFKGGGDIDMMAGDA